MEMGVTTMQPIVLTTKDVTFLKIVLDKVTNNSSLCDFLNIEIKTGEYPDRDGSAIFKLCLQFRSNRYCTSQQLDYDSCRHGKVYAEFTHWLSVVCPEIGLQIIDTKHPVPQWLIKRLEGDND